MSRFLPGLGRESYLQYSAVQKHCEAEELTEVDHQLLPAFQSDGKLAPCPDAHAAFYCLYHHRLCEAIFQDPALGAPLHTQTRALMITKH